jgi:hypothetical protein
MEKIGRLQGFIQRGDAGINPPLLDRGGISPFSLLSNVFENSVFKEMAICHLFKMNRLIQICIKLGVGGSVLF